MKSRICFLKKYKSIKFIDNKQGSMMAMVVVSVAALIILASMFIVSAFYNYRLGRTISYSESAYLAAESAAERWYGTIRYILTHEKGKYIGIDFPMEYGKEEKYVLSVLERIRVYGFTGAHEALEKDDKEINEKIRELIKDDSELVDLFEEEEGRFEPELRIRGEQERIINVRFGRFEVYDADRVVSTPEEAKEWGISEQMQVVKASVGFVLVAQVESSTGEVLSEANRVFVQKDIYVPYYEQIQALGAIYSMGDIIAIGDEDPNSDDEINLYGDVYSFGTFPRNIAVPEQWAYGGVMAVDAAKLNIKGSVLTRSFLRAGKREDDVIDDSSRIIVERDVMAQGIQTFSRGSKMYIYGNAYTLDDLEINAEDSIIAVNGNYIGLSADRDAELHDQTSSILNSGALHDSNHSIPTSSRIVVNGDILVPGVSWQIDATGVAEQPIESVGLLFPYAEAEGVGTSDVHVSSGIPSYRHSHLFDDDDETYQEFLMDKAERDLLQLGYSTIIQAWDSIDSTSSGALETWKEEIDEVVTDSTANDQTYGNLEDVWDDLANVSSSGIDDFDLNIVEKISGFVAGMVGANNSLYWEKGYFTDDDDNEINPTRHKNQLEITGLSENLEDNFKIFGFMPSEIKRAFDDGYSDMENWLVDDGGVAEFCFNKETSRDVIEAVELETSIERFWNYFWKPWDIEYQQYWDTYMEHALLDDSPNSDDLKYFDTRDLILDESDLTVYSRRRVLLNLVSNRLNRILWRGLPDNNADAGEPWRTEVNDDLEHLFEKIERLKTRGAGAGVVFYNDVGVESSGEQRINSISVFSDVNVSSSGAIGHYYLIANEDPEVDIVIKDGDEFRGIIVTRGQVRIGRGGTVYGTIFAAGDKNNPFNDISTDSAKLERLNKGKFAGIVLDLTEGSGDPPKIDFYLGNHDDPKFDSVIGPQRGRMQLLEKFRNQSPSVDLYQIF